MKVTFGGKCANCDKALDNIVTVETVKGRICLDCYMAITNWDNRLTENDKILLKELKVSLDSQCLLKS